MQTAEFLSHLRETGIELSCDGERLHCRAAKGVMTPEIQAEIQDRKEAIIEFLRPVSKKIWKSLVAIQGKGTRIPLFLFHGVGGNVLNYHALAKNLGPNQPLYGLQARGLDGLAAPLTDIPAMARLYLEEIRLLQPQGPYLLGGGSMGGAVAMAAGQQLQEEGQTVGLMLLVDTLGPNTKYARWFSELIKPEVSWWGHARDIIARGRKKILHVLRQGYRLNRCRSCLRRGVPIPHDLRFWYMERCHYQALSKFRCDRYEGKITLIRGNLEDEGWYADPERGWGGVATEGLDVIAVDGDHATIIEQPQLGVEIARCLESLET